MKTINRILSAGLMLVIVLSTAFSSQVYAIQEFTYENQAAMLNALGLFEGVSTESFEPYLQGAVNRETAIALLVKIFGDKENALSMTDSEADASLQKYSDKNDISHWAIKYIAYAVKAGMIQGDTPTTISPKKPIDGKSYSTMILRNLGYSIDGLGWSVALNILSEKGGLTTEESLNFNKPSLIRDDIVGISFGSLNAVSPSGETLLSILIDKGVVKLEKAMKFGLNKQSSKPPETLSEDYIAYNAIKNALLNMESQINISKYIPQASSEQIFKLIDKVVLDTPEILYYHSCTYNSNGLLEFRHSKDNQTALSHYRELEQCVKEIIDEIINPDMSDYEKELAIHNYIIKNTNYDMEYLRSGNVSPESYSAYGVLVLGTGVCEGYSEAMKLIMDRLNIECMIITGESKNQNHAWNIINIDGDYYHIDVTWDDPVIENGDQILTYNYFNITDEEISKDHYWNTSKYPACTAVKYNYFYYNDLVVDNYQDFYTHIKAALQDRAEEISLKVIDYDSSIYDVDIAVNDAFNETPGLKTLTFEYSINEPTGVINIRFE
jgi:hypothetical protein